MVTLSFAAGLLPPSSSIQHSFSFHKTIGSHGKCGINILPNIYSKTFSYRGGTNSEQSLEQLKLALDWLWTEHYNHEKILAVQLDVYFLVLSLYVQCFQPHTCIYIYIHICTYIHTINQAYINVYI